MAKRRKKRKQTDSGLTQRHPSGRLYEAGPKERREEGEREAMAVALAARERVFGLSATEARFSEAGSVIGRLFLSKEINKAQYDAAIEYEKTIALADAAILAKGFPTPGDLNRSHGHDNADGAEPGYVAKCRAATERANVCWRALKDADQLARWAVDTIVLQNQLVPALGELRVGLNALVRTLRITAVEKEAA